MPTQIRTQAAGHLLLPSKIISGITIHLLLLSIITLFVNYHYLLLPSICYFHHHFYKLVLVAGATTISFSPVHTRRRPGAAGRQRARASLWTRPTLAVGVRAAGTSTVSFQNCMFVFAA